MFSNILVEVNNKVNGEFADCFFTDEEGERNVRKVLKDGRFDKLDVRLYDVTGSRGKQVGRDDEDDSVV